MAAGGTSQATAAPGPTTWLGNAELWRCLRPRPALPSANLSPNAIGPNSSGNLPHENMQPFLTINFCIAYMGAFPSRN